MKKILLLMLVFVGLLTTSVRAQEYYYDYLNPNNVGSWIGGMHFINATTGWASSSGGTIHRTTDG